MTSAPTPAPHHEKHDDLNGNDSGGLTIPLSLAFGSIFITIAGLCCCFYKDNICVIDENLMGDQ